MFKTKTAAAALLGTALLTTAAFAQSPSDNSSKNSPPAVSTSPSSGSANPPASATTSPASSSSAASSQAQSQQGSWRASKMAGLNVYNDNNEKLGDISDLILDQSGKVATVVIGVGGFLGVGERYVSVNFDQLKFVNEPARTASSSAPPAAGTDSSRTVGASGTGSTSSTGSSSSSSTSTGSMSGGKNWYPDHAVLNKSKDELKSMPEFKY